MSTVNQSYVLSDAARDLIRDARNYIDGSWVGGEAYDITKLNPTTGEELGRFATASVAQVDLAIAAARRVHDSGVWRTTSHEERSRQLYRLVDLIEEHRDTLREIVVADVGTPVSLAEGLQIDGCIANFR